MQVYLACNIGLNVVYINVRGNRTDDCIMVLIVVNALTNAANSCYEFFVYANITIIGINMSRETVVMN